jgi:hypothetical protein
LRSTAISRTYVSQPSIDVEDDCGIDGAESAGDVADKKWAVGRFFPSFNIQSENDRKNKHRSEVLIFFPDSERLTDSTNDQQFRALVKQLVAGKLSCTLTNGGIAGLVYECIGCPTKWR